MTGSFGWRNAPELVAKCGIVKPHANNNRIERLNGTLRERVKVQRGWKSIKTPIAEGMRIQYNFVKPHMALNGQTPSEASGITIEGKNKWLKLYRMQVKPMSVRLWFLNLKSLNMSIEKDTSVTFVGSAQGSLVLNIRHQHSGALNPDRYYLDASLSMVTEAGCVSCSY